MNNKYKALLKDLFYFAISSFIPKAISFFLVRLYTNCLTTSEYGIADLLSTTVTLAVPFFTLDINDSLLRFTIENKENKEPLIISLEIYLKGILFVSLITLLIWFSGIIKADSLLFVLFLINYSFTALYGIGIAYLRATDRVKLLSVVSILTTLVTVLSNILFLVVLSKGLYGYLISGILGFVVADLVMGVCIFKKDLLKVKIKDKNQKRKKMLTYCMPLIASNVAWWVNSSSDRYIVTAISGIEENGIYSVAYKIPTILQMFQSVFSQAWLLSIYREYNTEHGKQYISEVFDYYFVGMSIMCALLIILDIPLASYLYAKDFYVAWKFVPFLLISVVFIAMDGFFGSMLQLLKKTKLIASTTTIGAIVNIVLNFLLIPKYGGLGAAFATMCGYLVMWIMTIKPVLNDYNFYINWKKVIIMILLLIAESLCLIISENIIGCLIIFVLICVINLKTIYAIINKVIGMIKTKMS